MTKLAPRLCYMALLFGPVMPLAAQPVTPPPLHVCSLKLRDGSMKLAFVEAADIAAARRLVERRQAALGNRANAASSRGDVLECVNPANRLFVDPAANKLLNTTPR